MESLDENCDRKDHSDYVATRKLSIVGRSYAVQSPIVPSIALSATTSLDHEDTISAAAAAATFSSQSQGGESFREWQKQLS